MKDTLTPRGTLVRCAAIVIGVLVVALGAAFVIVANLGSDTLSVFIQGMSRTAGISFGTAINIFNITCFVIILLVNRRLIGIGTLIYTLLLGAAEDWVIATTSLLVGDSPSMGVRVFLLAFGTLALSAGLGIYQAAEFGIGPSDALNQTIAKRLNISLKVERIGFDTAMVIGGYLLGGVVGVGTLIGAFVLGPIMVAAMNLCRAPINRLAADRPTQTSEKEEIPHENTPEP